MKTKFITALEALLKLDPKESLSFSGREVAKKYNCSTTCANYALQALKHALVKK